MASNTRSSNVKTKARNIAAAEKRARALELRKAGATFEEIAGKVGYTNRGNAFHAVMDALADITREPAEALLTLEVERLDALLVGLWPKAREGDDKAVHAVLRVMERRAKLLGLDDFEARMATVAERRVALEEAQAVVIVTVIRKIFDQLNLSVEQERLAEVVVPAELRLIETVEGDAS